MAGTKDIKDFTKYASLSDDDYLLGTKTSLNGTDASIKVGDLKSRWPTMLLRALTIVAIGL